MMRCVRLLVPDMPSADELLPRLQEIDRAGWYTNFGPLVRRLESQLAAATGADADSVTTVANCTLGLELALSALGLPRGASILIPALTFVATATAVTRAGYRPVVSDVDPQSWLLTPALAREALRSMPLGAVMPVTTFGCAQDLAQWAAFRRETGVPVVVDAAGGFGNQRHEPEVVAVYSLHATKSLGAGEGGFVLANRATAERVRKLSNFGIDLQHGWVDEPGTNAKLSEYHAAVALAALQRWERARSARQRLACEYAGLIAQRCAGLAQQQRTAEGVYTILAVLLPAGSDVARVRQNLQARGVETRRWYHPLVHLHPGLADCGLAGDLSVATTLSGRILGLPFHLALDGSDPEYVVDALAYALRA